MEKGSCSIRLDRDYCKLSILVITSESRLMSLGLATYLNSYQTQSESDNRIYVIFATLLQK